MLNPVFSTKHLRDMTPLFYEIIHKVGLLQTSLLRGRSFTAIKFFRLVTP